MTTTIFVYPGTDAAAGKFQEMISVSEFETVLQRLVRLSPERFAKVVDSIDQAAELEGVEVASAA